MHVMFAFSHWLLVLLLLLFYPTLHASRISVVGLGVHILCVYLLTNYGSDLPELNNAAVLVETQWFSAARSILPFLAYNYSHPLP